MISKKVLELFNGDDDRYRIPIYQRRYVWGETHWTHFWDDIKEKANSLLIIGKGVVEPAGHFTGVIVTRKNGEGEVEVVDGQQRLTTFQLILCAIRDICRERFPSDPTRVLGVVEPLLKNKPHPSHAHYPDKAYKLLPTEGADRESFQALIEGSTRNDDVLIQKAYKHFRQKIENDVGSDYDRMCAITRTLCHYFKIVDIPLNTDEESATVFESLNGRGLPLTQFDLLRNNVFLRAGEARQYKFYTRYWKHFNDESFWFPIENDIVAADDFLKIFLEVKLNRAYTPRSSLFDLYQQDYRNDLRHQLGVDMDQDEDESLVALEFEELQKDSIAYAEIATCDYNSPAYFYQYLKKYLRIPSWHPLILLLKTETELSPAEEKTIFSILESYIVRYILYYPEKPTWILEDHFRKLRMEIIDLIRESNGSFNAIKENILMVLKRDKNMWPSDSEVRQALREIGFHWSSALIRHILFKIESEEMDHQLADVSLLDYSNMTVEHVMPTAWENAKSKEPESLKTWPIEEPEGSEAYDKVADARDLSVRSIGNLTLLTEELNQELSHKAFFDKRSLIKGHSRLSLNADVISQDTWDVVQIRERENTLIDHFLKIWPHFTRVYKL